MTKAKLTKREKYIAVPGHVLLSCRRKACSENSKADTETHEENLSAGVGFLALLIVFLLGNLLGHWVSNKLREPTWHSPKGCPIYVGGTNGK